MQAANQMYNIDGSSLPEEPHLGDQHRCSTLGGKKPPSQKINSWMAATGGESCWAAALPPVELIAYLAAGEAAVDVSLEINRERQRQGGWTVP